MRKILFLVLCFGAAGLWAEDTFKAEDFDNQSQITVQDSRGASSCQAVRIAPKWYLTAAHCVRPQCDKECTIVIDLLQGPVYASAVVRHNSGQERVFVPGSYHPGLEKSIRYDIALIYFDPPEEDYFFKLTEKNQELSRAEFDKLLRKSEYRDQRAQWNALEKGRAKLLTVTGAVDRQVKGDVAVPDLADGTQLLGGGFYYFTQLRHFIGPDLGVEKGLSGSGVVVPGGAIIGIVSAALSTTVPVYNEKDEVAGRLTGRYFLFTPISGENAAFLFSKMKSFSSPGPLPYVSAVDSRVAAQTFNKLEEVFGELKSAAHIQAVNEKE